MLHQIFVVTVIVILCAGGIWPALAQESRLKSETGAKAEGVPETAQPKLRLPAIIGDNMVVQAEVEVPLWGWDVPGGQIEISVGEQQVHAKVGADGRWQVKLPPLKPGGPYRITVKGSSEIAISNVLAGEVWLCSGQSNMEYQLSRVKGRDLKAELSTEAARSIRLFRVPLCSAATPQADCPEQKRPSAMRDELLGPAARVPEDCHGHWAECAWASAKDFSAIGYFFGRELQRELKVPIGLIDASWGGTPAETWTSIEALRQNPTLQAIAANYDRAMAEYPAAKAAVETELARLEKLKAEAGDDRGWEAPAFDDSAWSEMQLPQRWKFAGLKFNGKVWFRKSVALPAEWRGRELTLNLGHIDGNHVVYVNGQKVGGGSNYQTLWSYGVPGALTDTDKAVIAVHVYHDTDYGGFWGVPEKLNLAPAGKSDALLLAGAWKYAPALKTAKLFPYAANFPLGPGNRNLPSGAFCGMIHPFAPFSLRGVIWYQGESNAGRAKEYKTLFPALIADWRQQWGGEDFPFLFVQLSETFDAKPETRPHFAELREAQLETLKLPHTGMAVTIDLGDKDDVHPQNKWDVGLRLAKLALDGTYGKKQVCEGPRYASFAREGARLRIKFLGESIGSGLAARGAGELKGFALRGANGPWRRAKAQIEGDTVVVWSEEVPAPDAARYAWAQNPFSANLINREGLPASPFRTDSDDSAWPILPDDE